MRNATIATSRTRAAADELISYRPLPAAWGDVESLQAVRATRRRAAERGLDPSTVEAAAPSRKPRTRHLGAHLRRASGLGRLASA